MSFFSSVLMHPADNRERRESPEENHVADEPVHQNVRDAKRAERYETWMATDFEHATRGAGLGGFTLRAHRAGIRSDEARDKNDEGEQHQQPHHPSERWN